MWDFCGERGKYENDAQEQYAVQHARNFSASACTDIDDGAHGRARARNSTKKSSNRVADALTDKFPIRVVTTTGHIVRYQRGQQAVDGTERRENCRGLENDNGGISLDGRHDKAGKTGRDGAQDG